MYILYLIPSAVWGIFKGDFKVISLLQSPNWPWEAKDQPSALSQLCPHCASSSLFFLYLILLNPGVQEGLCHGSVWQLLFSSTGTLQGNSSLKHPHTPGFEWDPHKESKYNRRKPPPSHTFHFSFRGTEARNYKDITQISLYFSIDKFAWQPECFLIFCFVWRQPGFEIAL